jgi:UDP-hydrolysing UDP-N-acetyl-D-glucosamine 2-epimerase
MSIIGSSQRATEASSEREPSVNADRFDMAPDSCRHHASGLRGKGADDGRRRICVFTGNRAEYGLIYPLLRKLGASEQVELQLLVSGAHLSPEFGLTYRAIECDGFRIDAKVEMLVSSDTPVGAATSMGVGVIGMGTALAQLRPELLVLSGDRYETFAAAIAGSAAGAPIAHIGGGQSTEGVIDDSFRHAITKLSSLHFTFDERSRQRVVQLGEDPRRAYNVGALGLRELDQLASLTRTDLEELLGMRLRKPTLLVTYHPSASTREAPQVQPAALLRALERFPEATVVMTRPNSDPGGHHIASAMQRYQSEHPERVRFYASLGRMNYLSLVRHSDVVLGNSSSGLTEAPALGVPSVNVGDRQKGRPTASSVIDSPDEWHEIASAIETAISPEFRNELGSIRRPYISTGSAEDQILAVLASVKVGDLGRKPFYDLPLRDVASTTGAEALPVAGSGS